MSRLWCSADRQEGQFPRSNWVLVMLLRSVSGLAYTITLPSMHEFITNPSNNPSGTADVQSWPGLGKSESFYSWAVTMCSLGTILGAFIAGKLSQYLPYRQSYLWTLSLSVVGYLLYFLTNEQRVWMILMARFIIGIHIGSMIVLTTTYLGETTTEEVNRHSQPDSNQHSRIGACNKSKKSLKDKLFICNSFVITTTYIIGTGLDSLLALIPSVDPYRWGAWLVMAYATANMVVFIITFKEQKTCRQCSRECTSFFKCGTKSRGKKRNIFIYSFLVICSYVVGSCYIMLDTLLNPILSDHFGFTVADNSYFMFGILAMQMGGSILLLAMEELGVNGRKRFILSLSMIIIGAATMSDWQSVGNDPCLLAIPEISDANNATLLFVNNNVTTNLWPENSTYGGNYSVHGNHSLDGNVSNNYSLEEVLVKASYCKAQSSMDNTCYWNPLSRVTGKQCRECYPVCRSMQKSLNFVQLSIGATLFITAVPFSTTTLLLIASDFVPQKIQGTVLGVVTAAAGFAGVVSPLWTDALYEASEKHTYPVMTVILSAVAVVLCTFCFLYNSLAPRPDKNGYSAGLEEEMNIVCNDGADAENPEQSKPAEGGPHSVCGQSTADQDSPKQGIDHSNECPTELSHKAVRVELCGSMNYSNSITKTYADNAAVVEASDGEELQLEFETSSEQEKLV